MVRSSFVLALAALHVAGCWDAPPPRSPDPIASRPLAVATDASALRPMAERERERLRVLIDLAEQRELRDGGPPALREAKERSRELDRIEARIDEAARRGASDDELDAIHDELRRLSTRLTLLADTLQ